MPHVTPYEASLRREVTALKSKAKRAHELACYAVQHARTHLRTAQVALNAAEDTMRTTAEVADADPI